MCWHSHIRSTQRKRERWWRDLKRFNLFTQAPIQWWLQTDLHNWHNSTSLFLTSIRRFSHMIVGYYIQLVEALWWCWTACEESTRLSVVVGLFVSLSKAKPKSAHKKISIFNVINIVVVVTSSRKSFSSLVGNARTWSGKFPEWKMVECQFADLCTALFQYFSE